MKTQSYSIIPAILSCLLTSAVAQSCNLNCPSDAPCTIGQANYEHQNFIQLENASSGMHCACPPGWTGVFCDHKFESCNDSHDCYHGGRCIEGLADQYGNDQLFCDCSSAVETDGTRYVGKYCETPFEQICSPTDDSLFCVNGGSCNPNYENDGVPCLCDDSWEGYHCEFKKGQVPECTLDCENGGTCVVGVHSPAEAQRLHRIWTEEEISDHMRCLCPDGFSGPKCQAESQECGPDGDECYHGGTCVTTTVTRNSISTSEYTCDCSTAGDNFGNRFAGKFCQIPSTVFCDENDDSLFCVNGGSCNLDDPTRGCACPDGYEGHKCEFHKGYQSDFTDDASEQCGDVFCMNGSECAVLDFVLEDGTRGSEQFCDCTTAHRHGLQTAYAGDACQYQSTEICSPWTTQEDREDLKYCVNGGSCRGDGTCNCPTGWTGDYCEVHTKEDQTVDDPTCGDKVCYNGGECVETVATINGVTTVEQYCDCSKAFDENFLYAGDSCQYKSTSLCTDPQSNGASLEGAFFCTNNGVCKKNFHRGCDCPDGFTGFSCEYLSIDEHPDADDQAVQEAEATYQECGEFTCKNGGTCITTTVEDEVGNRSTIQRCDCSTTATEDKIFAGLECEHEATVLCEEPAQGQALDTVAFCVQGGKCGADLSQACDCPVGWGGPKCEFAEAVGDLLDQDVALESCGDSVCLNGGSCVSTTVIDSHGLKTSVQHCDCSTAFDENGIFDGPNCEFRATTICTEPTEGQNLGDVQFCVNGGKCNAKNLWAGCECPPHWSGMHCQLEVEEELPSEACGEGQCLNGGRCVEFTVNGMVEQNCDCTSATDGTHRYDGEYCQYQSTSFCTEPAGDNLEGVKFCVNDGQCREDNTCHCPSGYSGTRCEVTVYQGQDSEDEALDQDDDALDFGCSLVCANGGRCASGEKDYGDLSDSISKVDEVSQTFHESYYEHCVCPDGFVGLTCEHKVEICGENEHFCMHGSTCVENNGVHACDCEDASAQIGHGDQSSVFAGNSCEHPATDICIQGEEYPTRPLYFCVNQGKCRDYVTENEMEPGCDCPSGWSGPHCELRVQQSSAGVAMEAGGIITITAVSFFFFALFLVIVTQCIRQRRTSDGSSRGCFGRKRAFGTSDAIGSFNIAPKRFSTISPPRPISSRPVSSKSDPVSAGVALTPDDEPGGYQDDVPTSFQDQPSRTYRDEPVLIDLGQPQEEEEYLQNVDFI